MNLKIMVLVFGACLFLNFSPVAIDLQGASQSLMFLLLFFKSAPMHYSKKKAHDFHQIPKASYKETDLVRPRLSQMWKLRSEDMRLPAQGHSASENRFCCFLAKVFWVSGDFPRGSISVLKRALLELAVLGTKGWLVGQPLTLLALPLPVPVGVL